MNTLVTGIPGLLATNLVRAVRWEGHSVRAVVPAVETARRALRDPGVVCLPPTCTWLEVFGELDAIYDTLAPEPTVTALPYAYNDEGKTRMASFRMGNLLGPGDISGNRLGRWILEFLRTGKARTSRGGVCVVDARDAAAAMMQAADSRASGEFPLPGLYVEFDEILDVLIHLTGRRPTGDGKTTVYPGTPAGSARAINELGATFRPIDETLRDVVAWVNMRGMPGIAA